MKNTPPAEKKTRGRKDLMESLELRYGHSDSFSKRLIYLRKKYSWLFITGSARLLKRAVDIAVSLTALVLLFPLMLLIALAIKLEDRGNILYIDKRVGKWGKEFMFPKFRSMKVGAEGLKEKLVEKNKFSGDITFKMEKDPRITHVGRFLRKSSLDELPQLWCVLIGNMTLVGPRPHLPKEVELYSLKDRRRLDVTPGLTGLWQVSGRSDLSFEEQVALDLQYIESQSLWLDLKLLLKTIPAVLFGKGAY